MTRSDKDWKGWRLIVLLYIFAKCGEAFIRDLGQSDTIDSLDASKSVFSTPRNSDGQAGIFFHIVRLRVLQSFRHFLGICGT
jgi:hypothetical protein